MNKVRRTDGRPLDPGPAPTVDDAPDAVLIVGRDGTIVQVNAPTERLFGYSRAQLVGATLESLLPEAQGPGHSRRRTAYFDTPIARPMTSGRIAYGRHQDGHCFPIEVLLQPMESTDGVLARAVVRAAVDRRDLDDVNLRLAGIVESAQDAIISAGVDGRIDTWNPAAEKLFGYTAAEARGRHAAFLKPPTRQGKIDPQARLPHGDETPETYTVRRTKGGRDIEVGIRYSAIRDRLGDVVGTSIVARDLTAQRQAESARFHLAAMIEHSGAAIMGVDPDFVINVWNTAAERLFGYTAAEATGQPGSFLIPPGHVDDGEAWWVRLRRGEVLAPFDTVRRRKDGTLVEVSISPSLIRGAAGDIVGLSAFFHDITDRKRGERELRAAHDAVVATSREYESFAYAVAHDLRAPLRAMNGFIRLGQEAYKSGQADVGRAHMERVGAASRRMGHLIDGLLRLAQLSRHPIRWTTVDLSALVEAVFSGLALEHSDRVLVPVVEPGLLVVADSDLLDILVTNLIGNAWKFTRDRAVTRIEFGREDDHYFVRDNGIGFDMAYHDKLFGTFQRLHQQSDYEGNGIGLATCQRIVSRHGGRIWAEGAVGRGATFNFTLPPPEDRD